MKSKAEQAIDRARVLLMPPHQSESDRSASRAEAVEILRSSLVPLMRADCPDVAEKIFNLILDIEAGK